MQLYIMRDRSITTKILQNAEKYGYSAIVLTVDAPILGKREADIKNSFKIPINLDLEILKDSMKIKDIKTDGSSLAALFANELDSRLTWDDLKWLKS